MTPSADHERLTDLVASVAIGAATPDECSAVERHAATCPVCSEELDSLRVTAGMLALGTSQIAPPSTLKREILASVRAERAAQTASAKPARRFALRLWPSLAGALAAAVLGLGAWNINLRGNAVGEERLAVAQVATNVTADAKVFDTGGRRVAVMHLNGLDAPGAASGYEVWVIPPGGAPVSRGFMERQADGRYVAAIDVSGGELLAVTPELRSNTSAPTGEKLAVFAT